MLRTPPEASATVIFDCYFSQQDTWAVHKERHVKKRQIERSKSNGQGHNPLESGYINDLIEP